MQDPKEAKALESINFAFAHYCDEANIGNSGNDYSEIFCHSEEELSLGTDNADILHNIKF